MATLIADLLYGKETREILWRPAPIVPNVSRVAVVAGAPSPGTESNESGQPVTATPCDRPAFVVAEQNSCSTMQDFAELINATLTHTLLR